MNVDKVALGRITAQRIHLLECHFAMLEGETRDPKYGLALVGYAREMAPDKTRLTAVLEFDAFHGIERPLIQARFKFRITYSGEGDLDGVWATLKDEVILAHCIPYVRELLSSLTSRMPVPPLLIETVNTYGMFRKFKEMQC